MADDPRILARFSVQSAGGGRLLVLEDAGGAVVRWSVEDEQLDLLADLIDDALGTACDD